MSLLDAATKLIGDRSKLNKLFLQNAALKHGVPFQEESELPKLEVTVKNDGEKPKPDPGVVAKPPVDAAPQKPARLPGWLKTLIALGVAGGTLGGGSALYQFFSTPPANERDSSLIQYLEDQGYHLPVGGDK